MSKKVKVLFAAHAGNLYGANRSLLDVLKGLDRTRFEPFLVSSEAGILLEHAEQTGVKCFVVPSKPWANRRIFVQNFGPNFKACCRIAGIIWKEGIDVVYTNTGLVAAPAMAAKLTGRRHLWHIRDKVSPSPNPFKFIDKFSHTIIANSEATKKRFNNRVFPKIAIVYNGFNLADYAGTRPVKNSDDIVLAIIGNIRKEKGQKEAILALTKILPKYPNVKLIFVGHAYDHNLGYQQELIELIKANGLEGKVLITGFVQDMPKMYTTIDILLIPSVYESFGRVAVEAMLSGVCVIAANIGGLAEIVKHQDNGILVNGLNPDDWAAAMINLLDRPDERERLVRNGKEFCRHQFRIEKTVSQIANIIEESLKH